MTFVHELTAGPCRRPLESLAHWGAWPVALTTACLVAWAMALDPSLAMALQFATMATALLVAALAERVVPFRSDWQEVAPAERRTDIVSMAVLMALADPIVKRGLLPLIATAVLPFVGDMRAPGSFPIEWPLPAQVLLAAVIAEFGQYWVHRAAHSLRWMWGVHAFHHNPERLYWLNGFRANPLNIVWHQLAGLGVLVSIGTPTVVIQVLILFGTVVAILQHANADFAQTGLNRVLATADLHRWHHARGIDGTHNFGSVLMLWDQLFGTYRRGGSPRAVGVDSGVPRANGYFGGLLEAMRGAVRSPAA